MQTVFTRRCFLAQAAACAFAAALPRAAHAAARPNFLVIFTDDQACRAVGFNNSVVQTPHLDAIAKSGTVFDRAYIATPICVASRASILTGLFPQQHGSVGLNQAGFLANVVEQKKLRTIAHELADAGYHTAFAGKSHLKSPLDYGFIEGRENNDRADVETFADANGFIDTRKGKDQPFFLWVAPHQPHIPLQPDGQYLDHYDPSAIEVDPNFRESPPEGSIYNQGLPGERYYRDSTHTKNWKDTPAGPPRDEATMRDFIHAYYATITQLDDQIGEMMGHLKASGHYDNTVIIFLSDNGYHLGNHGLGNKITMHEEAVHVPMFAAGPGIAKGQRSSALVSSLDVYPTLMALAGLTPPDHLQGHSLLPVFENPTATVRAHVFSECVGVGGKPGMGHRMVRTDRWKYVLTDENEEALFDEQADPYEMDNLAADPYRQSVLQELRNALAQWMDRIGDTHARPPAPQ